MPTLFEPTSINSMKLRNRIVRSAIVEGMCDGQGRPLPKLADYYAHLAGRGVGLIITGYASVCLENTPFPGVMGIHADDFEDDFRRLTRAAHSSGGAIAVQIGHAGGQADKEQPYGKPKAPSAVSVRQYPAEPEALTTGEIDAIIRAFGQAAGIDAIEVSAGTAASGKLSQARTKIHTPEKEAYHLDLARNIRAAVTCPVILVGGIRSYEVAEKTIRRHGMDYIAMARPMIREPDLADRWRRGHRAPAKCISCNGCFGLLKKGGAFRLCGGNKKRHGVNGRSI